MADPSTPFLPDASNTSNRLSEHDSESDFSTTRASHGSASENQPWMNSCGVLGQSSNANTAVPQMIDFYHLGRINSMNKSSLERPPIRKSRFRTRTRDSRKDRSQTRPKPEQSSPDNPATASSMSVSAPTSSPKNPTTSNTRSQYSPYNDETFEEMATSLRTIQEWHPSGNHLQSTLSVGNPSLAGARSSSRRAKTKINLPVSLQGPSRLLALSTPSNEGFRELRSSPAPGSTRKEDTTALPQYIVSQDNLEEQLNAARASQPHSPIFLSSLLQQSRASQIATYLYTISYLIFFSIFGTLARLGLSWLTFYPGAPLVTSVLWSNFGGSFILGWLIEDRRLFREEWSSHSLAPLSLSTANKSREKFPTGRQHRSHDCPDAVAQHLRVKKTIPLYIGLTVGFCGSFTSFSAFMRDAFLAVSNDLASPVNHHNPLNATSGFEIPSTTSTMHRNAGYSICALLAIIISTMCLSLSAFTLGTHASIASDQYTPTIPFTLQRKYLDRLAVILGFGCWLGTILLTLLTPLRLRDHLRPDVLFAIIFAPLGCLARFSISQWLAAVSPSVPLATFVVNVFGTSVEALVFSLGHISFSGYIGGGRVSCQVLNGIGDGFCGALTTVSTFVAELQILNRTQAYIYGLATIFGGLSMVIAVMGGVRWGVGWGEGSCQI